MKKRLFKLGIVLALPLVLMGCGNNDSSKKSNDKLQVSVSISPIREFTEIIGGDKIDIKTIVPDNVEAHDFELKTSSIKNVSDSDLFIYNGAHMEDWLDDLKYLCEPTEYHKKRVCVRFICDRGVSHEFVRHKLLCAA